MFTMVGRRTGNSLLLLLVFSLPILAEEKRAVENVPLDRSFLRVYAETRGFLLGRPVKPKVLPGGKTVLFLRSEARKSRLSLYEYDLSTQQTRELLTAETLLKGAEENLTPEEKARRERQRLSAGGFADFSTDETGNRILLPLSGKLYLFDREKKLARELKIPSGTILDPKWSPDSKKISYVRNFDLYLYDLATDQEKALTQGGTVEKTNGLAEFVAQEEMGRFTGYWWSPDSQFLAYEEADHQGVEVWYVADPIKPEQKPLPQYYPRPGKKNVQVRLGIIPVGGGTTVWVEWDRKRYEYLAAVRWDRRGPLTIQVQDRKQQELVLLQVDPATGKTKELLTERDPAWVHLRQNVPQWLSDGERFFFVLTQQGKEGLYLCSAKGGEPTLLHPLLPGQKKWLFVDFLGYDSKNRWVYCKADHAPGLPSLVRFRLKPDGSTEDCTEFTKELGLSSFVLAGDGKSMVLTTHNPSTLPRSTVYAEDWTSQGVLPGVSEEPSFQPKQNIEVVTIENRSHPINIIRPRNFDSTKKYPVIVDVYGGPHHLHVVQSLRNWLLPQWLADQGFIVVAIENRGTPNQGRDWERAIYQKFGDVPLADQAEVLQILGKKHPELDLKRVGIVGWSFGGYMSALAVLKRPDVFKAAVAGAPVTDWEDYDTHYTERYLGLLPESSKAYADSSLLPLAPQLSRPLLLVHGTADDNVYFRHTLRLSDALFRAGRDFEVLPLPGLTHMVPDPIVTERLWSRIAGHFQKHLGKAE